MTKIIFAALMAFSFGAFATEGATDATTTPPGTEGTETGGAPATDGQMTGKDKKMAKKETKDKKKKKEHAH